MSTNIIVNGNDTYVPVIIVTGAIYVAMCLALSALANWIEQRGRRARTGIEVTTAGEPVAAGDAMEVADAVPDKPAGKQD